MFGINTLKLEPNVLHFTDDIFQCIFLKHIFSHILSHTSQKFIPGQIISSRRAADEALPEPMMTQYININRVSMSIAVKPALPHGDWGVLKNNTNQHFKVSYSDPFLHDNLQISTPFLCGMPRLSDMNKSDLLSTKRSVKLVEKFETTSWLPFLSKFHLSFLLHLVAILLKGLAKSRGDSKRSVGIGIHVTKGGLLVNYIVIKSVRFDQLTWSPLFLLMAVSSAPKYHQPQLRQMVYCASYFPFIHLINPIIFKW